MGGYAERAGILTRRLRAYGRLTSMLTPAIKSWLSADTRPAMLSFAAMISVRDTRRDLPRLTSGARHYAGPRRSSRAQSLFCQGRSRAGRPVSAYHDAYAPISHRDYIPPFSAAGFFLLTSYDAFAGFFFRRARATRCSEFRTDAHIAAQGMLGAARRFHTSPSPTRDCRTGRYDAGNYPRTTSGLGQDIFTITPGAASHEAPMGDARPRPTLA